MEKEAFFRVFSAALRGKYEGRRKMERRVCLSERQFLSLVARATGEAVECLRLLRGRAADDLLREFGLPKGTKVVDTSAPTYIYFVLPDGEVLYLVEEEYTSGLVRGPVELPPLQDD